MSYFEPVQFRVWAQPFEDLTGSVQIAAWRGKGEKRAMLGEGLWTPVGDGGHLVPMLRMTADEAQQLSNALWEAGVRPTNGEGSVGQLGAVKEHLADMKSIAWHALKMGGKQ